MRAIVLIARCRLNAHDQAEAREHIGMMHMRGPAGPCRIIADNGALLVPVKKLQRRIDVDDVALAKQRQDASVEVPPKPSEPFSSGDCR
jgi:hypothetical protein